MKYRSFLPVLITAALLFPALPSMLEGKELQILKSPELTVYYTDSLSVPARETENIVPEVLQELEGILGWRLHDPPVVILVGDRGTFVRMVGSDHVAAVAIPRKQLIIVDHTRMTLRPFTLRNTLKHELCHLLLHEHIDGSRLPRWLDEGVAQSVSEGLSEILMKRNPFLVPRAAKTGNLIPLRLMGFSFPGNDQGLLLAYEASRSVVEFIVGEYGWKGLLEILEHLRHGDDIDGALWKSLQLSLEELEQRWHDHLVGRASWAAVLGYYVYEILFFFASFLLAAAFIRHMRRKRELSRFDDDDNDEHQEK